MLGVTHSEPYSGDPQPNDQTRTLDMIRRYSLQFADPPDHWDFDLGTEFARIAPALATIPDGAAVYVTIDADGIDPTEAPRVMAPVPGGLRFTDLAPFLRIVATRHRIVGLDLIEVAPSFDAANGITCITAGRLIVNAIGASWAPSGAFGRERAEAAASAHSR